MSSPSGPAAISQLVFPSPSVVVGDSMRDSNGVVTPVRVIAFDGNGDTIITTLPQLFVTDTLKRAHFTSKNILVGDSLGTARILGQIEALQTPSVNIPVTFFPAKIIQGVKPDTVKAPLSVDTTVAGSSTISARVLSSNDSASQGMIVKFTILQAPGAKSGSASPAVLLVGQNGPSTVDTTDQSGVASRTLAVRSALLADNALLGGTKVDSAVIEVSARYKGAPIPGSPFKVSVPIKVVLLGVPSRSVLP